MLIPVYVFIGRAKCGCIRAASVDDGTKQCAEDVAGFIRDGLSVERVTSPIAIAHCPHKGLFHTPRNLEKELKSE